MKKLIYQIILGIACISFSPAIMQSQLRITMVNPMNQTLRIKNFNAAPVDISSYRLCSLFEYSSLNSSNISVISGDFFLSQNEEVIITWTALFGFNETASDIGLYLPSGAYSNAANMLDFMQYGAGGQGREDVAVAGVLWSAGTFLPPGTGPWIYTGNGTQSGITFWSSAVEVTFRVNMALLTVSTNGVHIAGNFQGWSPSTTLMSDINGDDIYEYTALLATGTQVQYKYVNGNAWGPNWMNPCPPVVEPQMGWADSTAFSPSHRQDPRFLTLCASVNARIALFQDAWILTLVTLISRPL